MLKEVPPDKKIILVSHTPPYSLLDIGIRFGIRHIGSRSLKRFLDENVERIKMVICGHVHSQGGKTVKYKNCLVVNCASHDNEGELGKLAIIKVDKKVSVEWSYIYDERCEKLKEIRELKSIPLVGFSRAKILIKNGITNVFQVANLDDSHSLARHPSFEGSFELIVRYARAKVLGKPIIIGKHPFFRNIDSRNVYFFDAEYNSAGTKEGSYGIFLLGLMNSEGEIRQIFLDDPKYEKLLLEGFLEWVQKERPILISYSSKSADKPQLINSLKRFNLPTHTIENIFFDLFYDCLFTQKRDKQYIFLPVEGDMSLKSVADYFGYKRPDLEIKDGFQALITYNEYLFASDERYKKKLKENLLEYNRVDLDMVRYVFSKIKTLFDNYKS